MKGKGHEILCVKVRACTLCTLAEKRVQAVPGEGSLEAEVMFIGEGPGYYEDRDGRPFVGRAGQLLDQLLSSIGLERQEVYITNMIKCRPPNNRDPLPVELNSCEPYLDEQIRLIEPRVIVALGRYSFGKFSPEEPISKARGKPRRWKGMVVYPMYHPAAALRNPKLKTALEDDFQNLSLLLQDPSSECQSSDKESPDQLVLF